MKHLTRILTIALLGSVVFTGCKDDDDPDNVITPNTDRTVAIEVEAHWGANSFDMTSTYTDDSGTLIKFDDIRMYMSNFKVMDMGGTMTGDFPDAVLFDASQGPTTYTLGTVNAMHVHMVSGYIGLDSLTNHADPMLAAAPLNDATMHWGWNPMAGYKFVRIEGVADTNGDNTIDTSDSPFVYHLATDALYTPISFMVHADIDPGETKTYHLEVDVQQIIDGVDIANNLDTHTNNNMALAQDLMDNIALSISVQ